MWPGGWWISSPAWPTPVTGRIKKVSTNTYIITPYSVDLMGDLIDELENNGLYF